MGEVDSAEGMGTLLEAQVVVLSDPRLEEDLSECLAVLVDDGAVQEACSIGGAHSSLGSGHRSHAHYVGTSPHSGR